MGRNSGKYICKTTCNARAPEIRQIMSTGKPKVANTQIVTGRHPGQSHQRRYYSPAEAQTVAALRVINTPKKKKNNYKHNKKPNDLAN